MTRQQFEPLSDTDRVFRLVDQGSSFFPLGARLPLHSWLEPSSADKAEGETRGRRPGLSVWDSQLTRVDQASAVRRREARAPDAASCAFELGVGDVRSCGASQPARDVDVVTDPLDPSECGPGAEGHALVEGLARPAGMPRAEHKMFLDRLIACCVEKRDDAGQTTGL